MGDQVRCFHCHGGLRHWDPDDDPWTEHARWFPKCSFINLVKGHDFVAACSVDTGSVSNVVSTFFYYTLPLKPMSVDYI